MQKKNTTGGADRSAKRQQAQAMLAEQQRKARRSKILAIVIAVAAVLAIAIPTAIVIGGQAREQSALREAASQPIEGVQEQEFESSDHVQGQVQYQTKPGTGGDHNAVWLNCGVYDREVPEVNAVHSLEHGAVWISYSPDLPAEQVQALKEIVGERTYMLLTPYEGQGAPIKLSAWGAQLSVESADDPRIGTFIQKYRQGEQTPEPGAACTGGLQL